MKEDFLLLCAHHAHEARAIDRVCPARLGVLITRIRLGATAEPGLARHLRIRSSEVAVLYLSESLAEMLELTDPEEFVSALLPSPFRPEIVTRG